MNDPLVDFVNALDQDPALQEAYKENPKATAAANGVPPEDLAILFGDDPEALKARLDMAGLNAVIWIHHSK